MQKQQNPEVTKQVPDFLALAIARQCHDADNELRKGIGEKITEPDFESTPIARQRELIEAVQWVAAHPDADAKAAHAQWCTVKRLAGWIPAARTNEDRKEHACLFAWESLPLGQRRKDDVFLGTVRRCLASPQFKDAIAEIMALETFGVTSDTLVRGVIMADSAIGLLDELAANMPLIRKHVSFTKLSDTLEQIKSYLSARDLLAVKVKKHQKETSKLGSSEKEKAKHETEAQTPVPATDGPGAGDNADRRRGPPVGGPGNSDTPGECSLPPVEGGRESESSPETTETASDGSGVDCDSHVNPGGDGLDSPVGSPAPEIG